VRRPSSTKSTSRELIARASPTTRVVLPSAEDHDDGSEYESAQEDVEENEEDPLEDFPDDADVRDSSSLSPLQRFIRDRNLRIGTRTRAWTVELAHTTAIAPLRGASEAVVSPTERRVVSRPGGVLSAAEAGGTGSV